MKNVPITCVSTMDFYTKVKEASPSTVGVFRDGEGFKAFSNDIEVRITPDLQSKRAFDEFFHTGCPFSGTVSVPEDSDFGMGKKDEPLIPFTEAEAKALLNSATSEIDFNLKKAEILRRNGGKVPDFAKEPEESVDLPTELPNVDEQPDALPVQTAEDSPATSTEPVVQSPVSDSSAVS